MTTSDPLFTKIDDELWLPSQYTRGPGESMQGGAAAGLMSVSIETEMSNEYEPRSITVFFFKPIQIDSLSIDITSLSKGYRKRVVKGRMYQDSELVAESVMSFTRCMSYQEIPEPEEELTDPGELYQVAPWQSDGMPYHQDVLEKASDEEGRLWCRTKAPLTNLDSESLFSRFLPILDWLPGECRPDDWRTPRAQAFPNIEFSFHADRLPRSDWIGAQPFSRWRRGGHGATYSEVFDLYGGLGNFSTTLVLIPS